MSMTFRALVIAAALAAAPSTPLFAGDESGQAALVTQTASHPIQFERNSSVTGATNLMLFTVPPGKLLVVEHFSSVITLAPTATINRFTLGPVLDGMFLFSHVIPAGTSSPCGTCSSVQTLVATGAPIRLYVEAGQSLVANVTFSGPVGPGAFANAAFSGYLVDVK